MARTPQQSKEQVDAQVQALNRWQRQPYRARCEVCRGRGRSYAPLHGDPGLGYADAGPCDSCNGTGVAKD